MFIDLAYRLLGVLHTMYQTQKMLCFVCNDHALISGMPFSNGLIRQSSFLWGYLSSPIAGGTLVDYYGGKIVMGCGVALWSLATFLTPWAAESSLLALLATRALLGVAEGVALPCMNKMVARYKYVWNSYMIFIANKLVNQFSLLCLIEV